MSTEAMDWALEDAPPMPAQLVATLAGLARHADKKGRGAYPSVARLAAYACKAERSVQRDLKQLRELELIRLGDQSKAAHLPEGKRPEVYDLAVERTVPGGRAGSDEVTRTSRVTLASSRRRGGKKKPSSENISPDLTGDVDVTPDVDVTGDADVADGVTSTSQEGRRPRHPNQKTEPRAEPKDSYGAGQAGSDDERDYQWPAFGEFWICYPRSKQIEKAKQAWCDALDRGADPDLIIKAAKAYAFERKGEEPKYTPYPARWLNDGRYEDQSDEPGGWQPYQDPEDQSAYDQEF
ncbi:helix-turn-helix domain-containing protein [Streptomyces sp. NPDC052043]|uniref:helix-turn-helix domain-containing protein n=1 Tax=Streptomyces sp. NPDC052043 TaxID=3365684 RepID=UPI0037CF78A3